MQEGMVAAVVRSLVFFAWLVGLHAAFFGLARAVVGVWRRGTRVPGAQLRRALRNSEAAIVITGCTDGIGLGVALRLAELFPRNRFILVARNAEKLRRVEEQLKKKSHNDALAVTTIVNDFADEAATVRCAEELANTVPIVGLLINNVGDAGSCPTSIEEVSGAEVERLINVNIRSFMQVTRALLPNMRRNPGRGVIVNTGSVAAHVPRAGFSIYAATKGAIAIFSEALQTELRGQGIAVQCWEPGPVKTNMTRGRFADSDPLMVQLDAFVNDAIGCLLSATSSFSWLTFSYQPVRITPSLRHRFALFVASVLPPIIIARSRESWGRASSSVTQKPAEVTQKTAEVAAA